MQKLSIVLLLTAASITGTATAQDKLRLRNGNTTEVKVLEIGTREVTYKRWDNQSGPTYRVSRSEVTEIEYENGSNEDFGRNGGGDAIRPAMNYGRSVISLAPIQFTDITVRGVGLYYERAMDQRGILALQLPVVFSFPAEFNNRGYTGVFTSIQPGLKIYPRGFNGPVRYALGPSLVFGFGQRTMNFYNQFGQWQYGSEDVFHYGVLVNNSLNINPTAHLYLGLEFGLGLKYSNTTNNSPYGGYYYYESPVLANFNFRIGYRF